MKSIRTDFILDYLFEELRIIKNFPITCLSVDIFDEMLFVFIEINEILNANLVFTEITNKNKRLRDDDYLLPVYKLYAIRLYIELSQFVDLKHLCTQNEYLKTSICNQMTSGEYFNKANKLLNSHECPSSKSHYLKKCQCIQFQIVKFLACLSEFLQDYASHRHILNTSLKQSSMDNLLCSEFHSNTNASLDKQSVLLINLENIYKTLSEIKIDDLFDCKYLYLRKELYIAIEILASLFDLFCVSIRKIDCLNFKLNCLKKEIKIDQQNHVPSKLNNLISSNDLYLKLLASTIINLMKAHLDLRQFKQLNDLNEFLVQKSFDKTSSDGDYNEDIILIEKNVIFANNQELIFKYYAISAHYFLLKRNINDAISILKNKISNSTLLSGQQAESHCEAKYYYKYILFILRKMNCNCKSNFFVIYNLSRNYLFNLIAGYVESIQQLLLNENPLTLLEDAYDSLCAVANFYLKYSKITNLVFLSKFNLEKL